MHIFWFGFLTVFSQVGGIFYLVYIYFYNKIIREKVYRQFQPPMAGRGKRFLNFLLRNTIFVIGFLLFFGILSHLLIPPLAGLFGREPLPVFSSDRKYLASAKTYTWFFHRHYVTPELKKEILDISKRFNKEHPGVKVLYLDGNLPFIDNFPLVPHLSHDDGEKLDLSFIYIKNNKNKNNVPGWMGYGVCEEPRQGEVNYPVKCSNNPIYNLLYKISPQRKTTFQVDVEKTKTLLREIIRSTKVRKIFIEPHLENRWGFSGEGKVRFQGCHSVRHDDHIHLQL